MKKQVPTIGQWTPGVVIGRLEVGLIPVLRPIEVRRTDIGSQPLLPEYAASGNSAMWFAPVPRHLRREPAAPGANWNTPHALD